STNQLEQQTSARRWSPNYSRRQRMASQDTRDPMRTLDPSPRATPDSGLRAAWAIGALVVFLVIVAAFGLWNHFRSPTSSTAIGPSTTQSAPSSTGQGGAANTGAAR